MPLIDGASIGLMCRPAVLWLLLPQLLGACTCAASRSACDSVAKSNSVFIGTVVAIEPSLLDHWKPRAHPDWLHDRELTALRNSTIPLALKTLKERYLALLFDLPPQQRKALESAPTQEKLRLVMSWILNDGTRVRFKVNTTFQRQKDDDSEKGDAKDEPKSAEENKKEGALEEFADIWNEPGDCGIAFQKGETYLVYANDDEDLNRPSTSVCSRTARLSDSGEDLAYLHFFQNGGARSARLEGFVTAEVEQLQRDPFRYSARIRSPVSDVVVELKSDDGAHYTVPDVGGRFVFDGLESGDYQVAVFDAGFPDSIALLSGPKPIKVASKGCFTTTLLVLSHAVKR